MTYFFIAGVSTLVAIAALYYYFAKSEPSPRNSIRHITAQTSVIFSDAMIWFGFMANVAAIAFFWGLSSSFYEYALAILVACLFVNAGFLSLTIYLYGIRRLGGTLAMYVRSIPLYGLLLLGNHLVFGQLVRHMYLWADGFVDTPCYAADNWVMKYLSTAMWIEAPLFAVATIAVCGPSLWKCVGSPKVGGVLSTTADSLVILGFVIVPGLSFAALWYDLHAIIQIRSRARAAFGNAYADNSIGYGQVIAGGFALQAIFTYLSRILCKSLPVCHALFFIRLNMSLQATNSTYLKSKSPLIKRQVLWTMNSSSRLRQRMKYYRWMRRLGRQVCKVRMRNFVRAPSKEFPPYSPFTESTATRKLTVYHKSVNTI